ncbi:MAG: TetR/AcrR family transcriptional regulator C-terminal domain-containing protein [Acidimicrobiales bacterium]|jgi:AcrR family transcriptional regulator|nr:TetR/AcrR family transcriptional regulator C-terminal domain-containing protein [Acidimicrobiales bacterium]
MSEEPRSPLTRERVIDAAVAYVDEHGIEALSMRKLGRVLGVEAMSLYNHVRNKDDLLDGVLGRVMSGIPVPDRGLAWDDRLRAVARGLRDAGHRHPGAFPLFGMREVRSVEAFGPLEAAYEIFRDAGLDDDAALDAFLASASFVIGFVITELGTWREIAAADTIAFERIDLREHPRLAEMGLALRRRDAERQFEFGLAALILGLRAVVEARVPAP